MELDEPKIRKGRSRALCGKRKPGMEIRERDAENAPRFPGLFSRRLDQERTAGGERPEWTENRIEWKTCFGVGATRNNVKRGMSPSGAADTFDWEMFLWKLQ